jgi:hypothetical protein
MDSSEVDFIGKMVLDEVMELFATVLPPAEAKTALKGFITTSKDIAQIDGACCVCVCCRLAAGPLSRALACGRAGACLCGC